MRLLFAPHLLPDRGVNAVRANERITAAFLPTPDLRHSFIVLLKADTLHAEHSIPSGIARARISIKSAR